MTHSFVSHFYLVMLAVFAIMTRLGPLQPQEEQAGQSADTDNQSL
jgi:hypothetical protein